MEIWNEACDWPFVPNDDKNTCKEYPAPDFAAHLFLKDIHIRTPLFRMGWWYGYNKEKQFVRKAVPQHETVKEICTISKELRDGPTLGMQKSKTSDAVSAFIFELEWNLLQGISTKTKETLSPARIQPLLNSLKRLKSPPQELEGHLKRLLELHEKLE
jgi:hypothetical protein